MCVQSEVTLAAFEAVTRLVESMEGGAEDRGEDAPDAGDLLDGEIALLPGAEVLDLALQHLDLLAEGEDQIAQRVHAQAIGAPERGRLEQTGAREFEQVAHLDRDALFREHGMHLGLEAASERDELCPVADELAQLANRRRGAT